MNLLKDLFSPMRLIERFTLHLGGGGGGGGPTSSTVTNTNIPEYAQPYVETMLGATQKQLFNTRATDTGTEITGVKPYQAFGAPVVSSWNYGPHVDPDTGKTVTGAYNTYTPAGMGAQEMAAARAAVAGFDPMQEQAYQSAGAMQVPGAMGQAGQNVQSGVQQALGAGQAYGRQATDPSAIQAYMSPYMQNVVDVQKQMAQRDADIKAAQLRGQGIQQGRFGGSRTGLEQAQLQKDLAAHKNLIQATGQQNAFQNAQQAQQYAANLGLQGAQAGIAGAGQQAGIAQQQLAAQQGILGLQNQMGAQRQQQQQSIINQAIQNYANTQQYPQQQLSFMNAMLRGLPMQAMTTQGYQAAPNPLSQLAGLGMSAYGLSRLAGKKGGLPKDFEKKKDDAPGGLQALALSKM